MVQACTRRRALSAGSIVEMSMHQSLIASLYNFSRGSIKGTESGIHLQLPAGMMDRFFAAMVYWECYIFLIRFLRGDVHIVVELWTYSDWYTLYSSMVQEWCWRLIHSSFMTLSHVLLLRSDCCGRWRESRRETVRPAQLQFFLVGSKIIPERLCKKWI